MPEKFQYVPRFVGPLLFEDRGGFPFILTATLTYVTNVEGLGTIVVPAGFATDLASIPRVLWNVLPPVGAYDEAAVVHDYLYQTGWAFVTRRESDDILFEAMGVLGVSRTEQWTIFAGVRVGGWQPWSKYRAKEEAAAAAAKS